jgi:hypothetical protein
MPSPTVGIALTGSIPAPPSGDQDVVAQTDNGMPLQKVSFYPRRATSSLFGTVRPIENEIPSGSINGSNTTFTLANSPSPASSLRLHKNGLRLLPTTHYSLSGSTITIAVAPATGDNLVADYRF